MNFTANVWRASLLCSALTLAAGCAHREATKPAILNQEQVAALDAVATPPALDSATLQQVNKVAAEAAPSVLLTASNDAIDLTLADGTTTTGNKFSKVTIGQGLTDGSYTVQRLHGPERIVVDLFGAKSNVTKTFDTRDAALVSQVRVGAHPTKSRIVLDLVGDASVEHSASLVDGNLTLTLTGAAAPKPSVAPSDLDIQAIARAEVAEAEANRPRLASVEIAPAPVGGNMVVAELNSSNLGDRFDLQKTAPSEYVLTLKGTSVDAMNTTTVLAQAGTGAIRSVRPVIQGNDVLLRVFVNPLTALSARSEGNKILLTQVSEGLPEMRAQFAPEVEKKAVVDAKEDTAAVKPTAATEPAKTEPAVVEDAKIASLLDDSTKYTGRLISLDLQDTDIDNALRIIAEVSNLNIIASEDVTGKITLRLIDVPWDQALDVILKTNGLDKVQEGNVVRIAPVEKLRQEREALKQAQTAERDLEPLNVEYVRISYAKASELKPLVESVLSERGSVAYDERTNQLIIKDIRDGLRNVARLVSKLDLRTPQILLETQIVEANRSIERDLGAQLGFDFKMTPATGNPTGYNFPHSIVMGGSPLTGGKASQFPALTAGLTEGSSLGIALGSADGTRSLDAVLTAKEVEGLVRVVSRPSVATTNNKQALIKAVEKLRVRLPSGGLSVATGAGAQAAGVGQAATEIIEVGITLEVTPQASPDYYVLLDIRAKSSTVGSREVEGIPSEIERSATSTVLVSSGQTFAMGGIYKIDDRDGVVGVPFFKDIPVLGTFFRRSTLNKTDQELIFFITPRIIEGSFDDAAMRSVS